MDYIDVNKNRRVIRLFWGILVLHLIGGGWVFGLF